MKYVTLFFCIHYSLFCQSLLTGHWEGAMSREGSIQLLNLHFYQVGDSLEVQFDDPAKGFYRCYVDEIRQHQRIGLFDSVFVLNFGYGEFTMYLNNRFAELTGINEDWQPSVKVHLKKVRRTIRDNFTIEEVIIKNKNVSLAGTMYIPKGERQFPFVVLIHGSGKSTRRSIYARSLTYVLAQNGIGVLAYDKRGQGNSTGDDGGYASFSLLADDALTCLKYIRSRKDLSVSKAGFLGTSQGGWIAPIAANRSKDVDFIVLNVGPAVSTFQQDIDRVAYSMRNNDFAQSTIDSALRHSKLYFEVVRSGKNWEALKRSVDGYKNKEWAKEYLQLPEALNDSDMVWWRMNDYDPKENLSRLRCNVLSIFGGFDELVPPETNKPLMESYLSKSGCQYRITVFPGMTHNGLLYQTLHGGKWEWPENFWIWSKRPEQFYTEIVDWIQSQN